MERPSYLSDYLFDWESMELVLNGKSALDSEFFTGAMADEKEVQDFLMGYGLNYDDPVARAELFGNFQEALAFIKRYFLKEGDSDGLDLKIPNSLYMIADISDLFLLATGNSSSSEKEDTLWAGVILKVMHTILHVDKDLRSNYFSVIQTQIFDRFYKYIYRDAEQNLFLGVKEDGLGIPLVDYETKSKKTRDSVIIKLLHKAENVAEELFDRVGVRIITEKRMDTLRVLKFLLEKYVVIPHNVKPSRSLNSMIDLEDFKMKHTNLLKMAIRKNMSEENFLKALEREARECSYHKEKEGNKHSSSHYQSIQFTCRHLIKYKNPFLSDFNELRKEAKELQKDQGHDSEDNLARKILQMDVSLIARDIRFFYPYEVQIVDEEAHRVNTEGEASHSDYKKSQLHSARKRLFQSLCEYKGISL